MKTPSNVLMFAGKENMPVYEMFLDYWKHYRFQTGDKKYEHEYIKNRPDGTFISFDEKENQMNAAFLKEIMRVSTIGNSAELSREQLVTNPLFSWATFAVVSAMVDMILPQSIIDTIGIYTDVRTIGWGDSAAFDIEPRDLFVVSKAGRAQRSSEVHKQYKGQVTILPIMRELSTQVSLYKVLAGSESLAVFVSKVIASIETQMTVDVYEAFHTAMTNVSSTTTTGLQVSGYTQSDLLRLCQQVSAWNGGQKAIVVGTRLALLDVLPDDANYRYTLDSEYVKIGYIPTISGYDIMALPQVVDVKLPFGMKLNDSSIYIVSPTANKLVKLVLEGSTLSNTTQPFQNANLTQNATIWKSWGVGVATNAVAGYIAL